MGYTMDALGDALGSNTGGLTGRSQIGFTGLNPAPAIGQQLPVSLSLADSFTRQANSPNSANTGANTGNNEQRPLSTEKKIGLFLKGLISPLTDPFSSVKSFAIAAGVFIAHAAIIGATGGAAAVPMLVMAGATGVYHMGKALVNFSQAKNTAEEEKAIKSLGAGIGNLAMMGIGAKPALREGTTLSTKQINKMSMAKALKENVKQTPEALRNSKNALQSGHVVANTKTYMSRQITETREKIETAHKHIKTQWADKQAPWQDKVKNTANGLVRSLSITSLLGMQ
jgi:hypothetical protein